MKATCFRIVNNSKRDILLWPNDIELQKEWGMYIAAGTFKFCDYRMQGLIYAIDFDECHFNFVGLKRKIKPKNIHKHQVFLEIYE